MRFLMESDPDGPFWYACDLCGYAASVQPTINLAAHAWNTEKRGRGKDRNPVVEDTLNG